MLIVIPVRVYLNMALNSIRWWGFSSGDLDSVEYSFIDITPRYTLTQMRSIDWLQDAESKYGKNLQFLSDKFN